MPPAATAITMRRRTALQAGAGAALGVLWTPLAGPPAHADTDQPTRESIEWLKRTIGRDVVPSDRVRLQMPAVFNNGYSVPMVLSVASAMTDADFVRFVTVFAPRNPITTVAAFRFTPQSGRAEITTRIRLAQPQNILAVAEISNGAFLMNQTWVKVETNGCE